MNSSTLRAGGKETAQTNKAADRAARGKTSRLLHV